MPLHTLTRRDALLILIGASCVYMLSSVLNYTNGLSSLPVESQFDYLPHPTHTQIPQGVVKAPPKISPIPSELQNETDIGFVHELPETTIMAHAPGWTLFRNLYMSNGTLFIVSSQSSSSFPEIRLMTSTGLAAFNTPESIAEREPTEHEMKIIQPVEAKTRWGGDVTNKSRNRVWTVSGNTLLSNDPSQFLDHYYHFVGELLVGTRAFLYGAFNPAGGFSTGTETESHSSYEPPSFTRAIFIHAHADGWRDKPGFNSYFLRAVFPSISVEVASDWADRVASTASNRTYPSARTRADATDFGETFDRAWHFPLVLLTDRSAANRGDACGSRTQRIAAEAWEFMVRNRGIDLVGHWWGAFRHAVSEFAGSTEINHGSNAQDSSKWQDVSKELLEKEDPQRQLDLPHKTVITYVNRQSVRRHLIEEHHNGLVDALEQMVKRKNVEGKDWELNIVKPETMTKDEQVRLAGRTTILLGVHGNGLTHLVLMKPSRFSAVIEIFYPGGFARDYEWTTRALGMRHFTIWNDTYFTHPNEPQLGYPEGFQGTSIPVYGAAVADLIEKRLEGNL